MNNLFLVTILTLGFTFGVIAQASEPYKNAELSDEVRVDDLLSRMTLIEKIGQMSQFVGPEHIARS